MSITVKLSVGIVSSSVAAASVITTLTRHGFLNGASVTIQGHAGSTPAISGVYVITYISATTFSIPLNVTVGGTGGRGTLNRSFRSETFECNLSENHVDSFKCKIDSLDASFIPDVGQEVVAYEGVNGFFGGLVTLVEEGGLGGEGVAALEFRVEAVSFDKYASYRVITETIPSGSTLKQALQQIEPYFTGFGVVLDPSQANGPTFSEDLPFVGIKGSEILLQFAKISNWNYEIDYAKILRMVPPASTAGPFDVTDANQKAIQDVVVTTSEQGYANRVTVKAGDARILAKTDIFPGNGVQTAFVLTHQAIGPLSLRGYIINGSVSETLGTGADWQYDTATNTITRTGLATGGGPPAVSVTVTYDVQFPISVVAEDLTQQGIRGIIELIYFEADVFDVYIAGQMATNYLARALAKAKTVKYITSSLGILRPGHTQTINITNRHINAVCTVTQVRIWNVKGNLIFKDVTAVEGTVSITPVGRTIVRNWTGAAAGSVVSTSGPATVGGTGPSGIPGAVQYQKSGAFAGHPDFLFEEATSRVIIGGQYYSPATYNNASGASATVNWNLGNDHVITLTANCTLTFSNPVDGGRYQLLLRQDGTGGRTVTWPSTVKFDHGVAPFLSTPAGFADLITFMYVSAWGKYVAAWQLRHDVN